MPTNKPENATEQEAAPFFVGYLPMPPQLKSFYWRLAAVLIVVCGLLGYWVAAQQKPASPAHWNTAQISTIQGLLSVRPYPILHRFNPQNPHQVESILLVSPGKHSAAEWSADFAQQMVSVDGYEIHRGGWTMLEIAAQDAVKKITEASAQTKSQLQRLSALPATQLLGEISLQGEIVDSKCFLGVMKPGAGKIHKACAEVCLLGGIPPMLIAKDATQQQFGYLLTTADGGNAAALSAKFAAETVQISGQLQQQGDLLFIAMNEDGIQRR